MNTKMTADAIVQMVSIICPSKMNHLVCLFWIIWDVWDLNLSMATTHPDNFYGLCHCIQL